MDRGKEGGIIHIENECSKLWDAVSSSKSTEKNDFSVRNCLTLQGFMNIIEMMFLSLVCL